MTDATGPSRCPWCSAELPAGAGDTCPTCGATLNSTQGPEPDIRGVTTLDHEAILRARSDSSRPRNRFLSFITGEATETEVDPTAAASVAPPDAAVRREMLRLQIEAERASLEAESLALRTDVIVEQGIDLAALAAEDEASEAGAPEAESTTASGDIPPSDEAATATPPEHDTAIPDSPPLAGSQVLPPPAPGQPPAPGEASAGDDSAVPGQPPPPPGPPLPPRS